MFGDNEEKNNVSGKDLRNIEKDLIGEARKSEFEHTDKDRSQENAGDMGDNKIGGPTPSPSVPIPQEIPRAILGGISFLVYEKRIQSLHKEHKDDARKVITPTENQVSTMGNLLTWFADRYAPALCDNPWFVPATMAFEIGRIELVKFQAFQAVVEASKAGDQ